MLVSVLCRFRARFAAYGTVDIAIVLEFYVMLDLKRMRSSQSPSLLLFGRLLACLALSEWLSIMKLVVMSKHFETLPSFTQAQWNYTSKWSVVILTNVGVPVVCISECWQNGWCQDCENNVHRSVVLFRMLSSYAKTWSCAFRPPQLNSIFDQKTDNPSESIFSRLSSLCPKRTLSFAESIQVSVLHVFLFLSSDWVLCATTTVTSVSPPNGLQKTFSDFFWHPTSVGSRVKSMFSG